MIGQTNFNLHLVKSLLSILSILFVSIQSGQAQEKQFSKPSWYFGVAVAGNLNFYRGSTQMLNASFTPPTTFHNGFGDGIYFAPNIEYHNPESKWGFIFQAGFDNRKGKFNTVNTSCNCPADLDSNLTYITVEPSLRFAPFKTNFYLFGGPRFAFNHEASFTYSQKTNPNFPLQIQNPDVNGDFSNINKNIISMQIGMGFDIPLNSSNSKTQYVVSPFVSYHPYFGQNPRSVETWNVQTIRAGFVLKFGKGHLKSASTPINDGELQFTIQAPTNVTNVKTVREVFPIRNYVFFDKGSSSIPSRYVLLNKNEVKDFKEDKVELNTPKNMSGRSNRQMIVYYNVLNIIGDRMSKNKNTSITLVGSSDNGSTEALVMAQNVKNYLVSTFDIAEGRIKTEGREKPAIPSVKAGGTKELELLSEGNRRVSIESNSPELLMEFQSGKEAPLKPVEIYTTNQTPDDVVFNVPTSKETLSAWSLQIKGKDGITQNYGPYTENKISIPRKTIMGSQPAGNFKVMLNGTTKTGSNLTKESTIYLTPYIAPEVQESIRFSVIYEYNESKSIDIYEKYLTEIVTPKIPNNGKVIITGYTDIIGEVEYNKSLSLARANDVKNILEKSLASVGRKDVIFKVIGNGEDENLAPFNNKYPEERFYNRTVVIDVMKK